MAGKGQFGILPATIHGVQPSGAGGSVTSCCHSDSITKTKANPLIVSFDHRFIFVKTRKTAGTSVEMALTPHCGPNDILTPLRPSDEVLRVSDGVVQARNFAGDPDLEQEFRNAILAGDLKTAHRIALFRAPGVLYNHAPIRRVRKRVSADFWSQAFKFTIERHPYEKAVSGAHYRLRKARAPMSALPGFVDKFIEGMDDSSLYTIDGELAVDRVIRFENLQEEFGRVAGELGLALQGPLPRAKATARQDRRPASEVLSATQKQKIFERCRNVFEMFDYDR